MKKIIVIGSGVAGLASAVRLKLQGHEVHVYEANAYPGGKLTTIESKGYRFDAGPSICTFPDKIEELFVLAGKDPKKTFTFTKLNTLCNYFYSDGTVLKAHSDKKLLAREISEVLKEDRDTVLEFMNLCQKRYETTEPVFLNRPLNKIAGYLNFTTLKAVSKVFSLGIFNTMHKENAKKFKNKKTIQYFDRYATFNGSNPYTAPALLNLMSAVEYGYGVYFPEGGMISITNSIYKLAKEVGVTFHFNSVVNEILHSEKRITGIKCNNELVAADIVVCNNDVYQVYNKLLKNTSVPTKTLEQERSSSAIVFYWGIKKVFDQLIMHNVFFSDDYKSEFESIFQKNEIYSDPTIYLNITSGHCKHDAPVGCSNWFVMINVPNNTGQNWDEYKATARKCILAKLTKVLGEDISSLIETEETLDPILIENRTSSFRGSIYGNSSNNKYSAFLRHPNDKFDLRNLYFCGGSVHPGAGIPVCLQSAKITAEIIRKEHSIVN